MALKSLDDYAIAIFKTPWARKPEDEEFFQHTLQTVGEIVKDDVKLGTIYIFLVLATPIVDLRPVQSFETQYLNTNYFTLR